MGTYYPNPYRLSRKAPHVRLGVVGGRRGGAFNLPIGALREKVTEKVTLTDVCDLSQEAVEALWVG